MVEEVKNAVNLVWDQPFDYLKKNFHEILKISIKKIKKNFDSLD